MTKEFNNLLTDILNLKIYNKNDIKLNYSDEKKLKLIIKLIQDGSLHNYSISKIKENLKTIKLSEEEEDIFQKFWSLNSEKIHEFLIKSSKFNSELSEFKWRIDQVTNVKDISQMNQSAAIIELTKNLNDKKEKILFEVDKETIKSVLKKLNDVNDKIKEFTN